MSGLSAFLGFSGKTKFLIDTGIELSGGALVFRDLMFDSFGSTARTSLDYLAYVCAIRSLVEGYLCLTYLCTTSS